MASILLKELYLFTVQHTDTHTHGYNQEWFQTEWQRQAGCGATVCATILHYLQHANRSLPETFTQDRAETLARMERMWEFVTPTRFGVNKTSLFVEGAMRYAQQENLPLRCQVLDEPGIPKRRPTLAAVREFLAQALLKNLPVAFLNLDNGKEKRLDAWHWVTIVGMHTEDEHMLEVDILDEGQQKRIDLALWHKTHRLGGGFVCMELTA